MENYFDAPIGNKTEESSQQLKGFSYYFEIIQERKLLIVSITLAFFLVSWIYFSIQPNIYEASAQILVEKSGRAQELYQQTSAVSPEADQDYYGTQISILTGKKIAGDVEDELGLPPGSFGVKAKRVPMSRVIILTAKYKDPEMAAKISNLLAEKYIEEKKQQDLFLPRQVLEMLPNEDEVGADYLSGETAVSSGGGKKELPVSFLNKITTDPLITKLTGERLDIQSQIRDYSQRYKWKHPVMLSLNSKKSFVEGEIKDRMKKILIDLKTSLTGEFNITNIKVLTTAEVPEKPVSPKRVSGIFLSTLAGFIFSIYLSLFLESSNRRIRHEEDLNSFSEIVYLGSTPLMKEIGIDKKTLHFKKRKKQSPPPKPTSLVPIYKKDAILADVVAKVRTHIFFSAAYEKSKSMMMVSGTPNEGKSTVTTLLSLSLDGIGKKVVVIDADLRRPSLNACFGVENDRGLREYLAGEATVDEVLKAVPGTEMKLISGGTPTSNPTELLANDRFNELLKELYKRFDRVVIDVPPILFIPDAFILAKYVQSSVLVCRAGFTEKKEFKLTLDQFEGLKPAHEIIGVVINGVNFERYKVRYKHFTDYKKYYYGYPKSAYSPITQAKEKK